MSIWLVVLSALIAALLSFAGGAGVEWMENQVL
jgi:hypothetical protein